VDCGVNTAPGFLNRAETEKAMKTLGWDACITQHFNESHYNECTEDYIVRAAIWKQAGMEPMGGCLCIGCLEERIGRRLRPKDFQRGHPLNRTRGTARLLQRRGQGR
jgi:hypothetical protein